MAAKSMRMEALQTAFRMCLPCKMPPPQKIRIFFIVFNKFGRKLWPNCFWFPGVLVSQTSVWWNRSVRPSVRTENLNWFPFCQTSKIFSCISGKNNGHFKRKLLCVSGAHLQRNSLNVCRREKLSSKRCTEVWNKCFICSTFFPRMFYCFWDT